jgi:hemoglobin
MSASTKTEPGRRDTVTQDIVRKTGIDEAMIERLVRGFYAEIRTDPLLGPIFADRISDWEHHIAKLCDFWSSIALLTGRYHGQPMQAHLPLPVEAAHFEHWLRLFEATARRLCPPAAAEHFLERARRIAESLRLGIAFRRESQASARGFGAPTPLQIHEPQGEAS